MCVPTIEHRLIHVIEQHVCLFCDFGMGHATM
jgi:hypothetical protein